MRAFCCVALVVLMAASGGMHAEHAAAQRHEWRSRQGAATDIELTQDGVRGIAVRTTQPVVVSTATAQALAARSSGPVAFAGVLGAHTPLVFSREQRRLSGMIDVARGLPVVEVRSADAENLTVSIHFANGIELSGLSVPARLLSIAPPDSPEPTGSWDVVRAMRSAQVQITQEEFDLCDTPRCGKRLAVHQPTMLILKRTATRDGYVRIEFVTDDGALRGWVREEVVTSTVEAAQIGANYTVGGLGLSGTGPGGGSPITSTRYSGIARLPAGSRVYMMTQRGIVAWGELTESVQCQVSGDTNDAYFDVVQFPNIELVEHVPGASLNAADANHRPAHVVVRTDALIIPPHPDPMN